MIVLQFSICILSWNNLISLENTLKSYKKNGLLDLSDDIIVLIQDASAKEIELAKKYKIKYIALDENIGIGKGFMKLAENALYESILFLENDWQLVEEKNIVHLRLNSGLELLKKGYDIVRYRSRTKPGHPLYSIAFKGRELDYYDDWHKCTSPHLLESLYWLDPALEFPDKIQKEGEYFITTSRWANWTNNPFLIKKEFYLKTMKQFSGTSTSLEKNIASWWSKQNFKIAQGEGLFMHNDLKKYPPESFSTRIKNVIKTIIRKQ
ncbi:glycosyltransferase family 2 protein [Chryseobacterium taihuense]|uniref:Glycosyl transferase family 2 n=1 Tax=Chryseobacterium taihuense TaxID=1141221 RepID=A0ABY0QTK9_9FLAO|nr:glycosyltransferase [Chryseobacterium taihuense]SDL86230.1 Glycosyl transferase family 2 [Chryseobacterium taihuense]